MGTLAIRLKKKKSLIASESSGSKSAADKQAGREKRRAQKEREGVVNEWKM